MWVKLRHVKRVTAKGRVYWYHQRTGERLPDGESERAAAVVAINERLARTGALHPTRSPAGSMGDLIATYKSSSAFTRDISERTRKDYRRYLDYLAQHFDDLPVSELDREFVLELREKLSERPRTADLMIAVLSLLCSFAIDRPKRFGLTVNPAAKPKRIYEPGDANRPWSDDEIDRFLAAAPLGLRVPVALGLYTGQREADVLRMTWAAYRDGGIALRQAKTGTDLFIPVHPRLAATLDEARRAREAWQAAKPGRTTALTIVTGGRGRPLTPDGFRSLFYDERKRLGLLDVTFHGLRHTAAGKLAEVGCSDAEIMAVTGHKSEKQVKEYRRRADQKRLATAAIGRLPGNAEGPKLENRAAGSGKPVRRPRK